MKIKRCTECIVVIAALNAIDVAETVMYTEKLKHVEQLIVFSIEGYPYHNEEDIDKQLKNLLGPLTSEISPLMAGSQLILMTHFGPNASC